MTTPHSGPGENFKSGFVSIVGAPNVGKSTLLNRMLGQKISITSRRPQTTRNRILGILHRPASQIIFIDTPGIHRTEKPLNTRIVDAALSALGEGDLALVMADVSRPDPASEAILMKSLRRHPKPAILALNKIDRIKKHQLLAIIQQWAGIYDFENIVPVSAKTGQQVEDLIRAMETVLPPGPPYFPEDCLTDQPERFIAAEMIREKVFRLTGEEIPYATAVTVDGFRDQEDGGVIRIAATIHVERNSQKGIIIGKGGRKLKEIGTAARKEIERMVGAQVFLKLFVRVQKNWSCDTKALRRFGY